MMPLPESVEPFGARSTLLVELRRGVLSTPRGWGRPTRSRASSGAVLVTLALSSAVRSPQPEPGRCECRHVLTLRPSLVSCDCGVFNFRALACPAPAQPEDQTP